MRQPDNTRCYQSFPSVIPVCRASSLRVTHPSALPRLRKRSFANDLHVLSILSAFILSQDQTLHSIYFSYILFPPLSWRVSCLQGKCSWLLFISYTLLLLLFLSSIVLRHFFVSTRYILSYPLPFVNYFFPFFLSFFHTCTTQSNTTPITYKKT